MADLTPRLVHLVWLGSDVPAQVERLRADLGRHNPNLEVRIWRDVDLTWLRNHAELLAEPRPSGKANIARYELLLRFGGLYLDADVRVHRSLGGILTAADAHGLVVVRQSPTVYNPAVIAAVPGHPVLAAAVEGIPATAHEFAAMSSPARTGPHYFTAQLVKHLRAGGTFHELPQHAAFPWYADEDPIPAELIPTSVALSHEWAALGSDWSWGDAVEVRRIVVPDRRSRERRNGGSFRARAAARPSTHWAIAALERIRDRTPRGQQWRTWNDGATDWTGVVLEGWAERYASRLLRGSACFLDLHPASDGPALRAAHALDRPGRVTVVSDPAGDLPHAWRSAGIRSTLHRVITAPEDPDRVLAVTSRGTPLLPRTVSQQEPPTEAIVHPPALNLADLIDAVPRFDLVRARTDRLTSAVAQVLGAMTGRRRIARLLLTVDPSAVTPGLTATVDLVAELDEQGLPIRVGPWLVDGRGRTWRQHLRVAARPFQLAVGP